MDGVPLADKWIRRSFGRDVPPERDPIRSVDALPTETRYRLIASRDDPQVVYAENAEPFVESLSAAGADVEPVLVYGGHQDEEHFNGRDVLSFANTCLPEDADETSRAD